MKKFTYYFIFILFLSSCAGTALFRTKGYSFISEENNSNSSINNQHIIGFSRSFSYSKSYPVLNFSFKNSKKETYISEILFLNGYQEKSISFGIFPILPIPPVIPLFFIPKKYEKCSDNSKESYLLLRLHNRYYDMFEVDAKNVYIIDNGGNKIFANKTEYYEFENKGYNKISFPIACKDIQNSRLYLNGIYLISTDYYSKVKSKEKVEIKPMTLKYTSGWSFMLNLFGGFE